MTLVSVPTLLFILSGCFIEPGTLQDLVIQPEGTDGIVTVPLNQMRNATFDCECTAGIDCSQPYWSLENNGVAITTDEDPDEFAERGITYSTSSDSTMAFIGIPDTVENNNTLISCVAFLFGGTDFSNQVELIIIGPPLPPEPVLVINSSSQLDIHWAVPYSNERYPVVSYNIEIVNMSSASVLANVVDYNETSFVHVFDGDVVYCQILTVNITAVNALTSSVPGSASRGFPIAPHPFEMDIDVDVTFLRNGTPMASITFEAPRICDYQTANYSITIEDVTDPRVDLEPIKSTYAGSNRNVMEVVMLTIDHNYMLFVSVVENHFNIEVSASKNFTTLFQSGAPGTSPGHPPHELGIYVGVPVAVLLFLLLITIVIVAILGISIVRKKKEWRLSRGGGNDVRASSPVSVYETINDYQIQQEVKPNIHLSPQQQEFLWKVQHRQHGAVGDQGRPMDDSSYQAMMSSAAITEGRITMASGTADFTYPPFAAANQQLTPAMPPSRVGNPYTQQPCPAAAGSSASPVHVLGHGHVTVTTGGVFLEDDDQEYTAMSQAGTLTSQQSNRTGSATVAQHPTQSASGVNAAIPTYSVVNKGESSKSQTVMVTEC